MDGVYHPSATAAVTFNPFLPAIGRVYQVLCDAAPAGATIEINNRDLAAAAGLQSAGHIPRLLRQLETQGYIERIADRGGSLIVVTDRSRMRDHDAADRAGDPAGDPDRDHPPVAASGDPDRDHADRVLMRDRSSVRVDDRSRMRDHRDSDSPPDPPMVLRLDSMQEEESSRAQGVVTTKTDQASALLSRLTANPAMDLDLAQRIANAPPGTAADFAADCALAGSLPGIRQPFWFTVYRWSRGQRVMAKEICDERRPVQPGDATHRAQRFARPAPGRSAPAGALARSHLPAGLLGVPAWFDEFADDGGGLPVGATERR